MKPKLGKIALDHGQFQAFLRAPRLSNGERSPVMRVLYRLRTTDPAVVPLIESVRAISGGGGELWSSARHGSQGWTVTDPDELQKLGDLLRKGAHATRHPVLPLIDAWVACVDLLPAIARKQNPNTYRPSEFAKLRLDAVANFHGVRATLLFKPAVRLEDVEF